MTAEPHTRPLAAALVGLGVLLVALPLWALDSDGDGVDDPLDNCLTLSNPDQRDPGRDGYGIACDADYDGTAPSVGPTSASS